MSVDTGKSKIHSLGWQARVTGGLMVQFQFKGQWAGDSRRGSDTADATECCEVHLVNRV